MSLAKSYYVIGLLDLKKGAKLWRYRLLQPTTYRWTHYSMKSSGVIKDKGLVLMWAAPPFCSVWLAHQCLLVTFLINWFISFANLTTLLYYVCFLSGSSNSVLIPDFKTVKSGCSSVYCLVCRVSLTRTYTGAWHLSG